SQLAASTVLPTQGKVFVSVREADKTATVSIARELLHLGFTIVATSGTARFLKEKGLEVETVNKVREGRPHIVDLMKDGEIALIVNTTEGAQAIKDSYSLRRTALVQKIPYYTTLAGARAAAQ